MTNDLRRRSGALLVLQLFVGGTALATALGAAAQGYPDRPIRFVVTHAAGGALDASARQLADKLGPKIGQQIIVDNRPGAAGLLAAAMVAKAPPDGYTLAFVSSSFTILPLLHAQMPFAMSELTAVASVVSAPFVLVTLPKSPFKTLPEFLALAHGQPGRLTWGSGGNGSFGHLLGAWLSAEAKISVTHVPYKGESPALQGLLGNEVSVMPLNITSSLSLLKAGKLQALAVSGDRRSPLLPDVPTIREVSVPVSVAPWFGLLAPAGVPKAILDRLNKAVDETLQEPELRDRFIGLGFEVGGGPRAALQAAIERERAQWAQIVKERQIRFD